MARDSSKLARNLPGDSVLLLFDAGGVEPVPGDRLLFYPSLPPAQEPPLGFFSAADACEFQRHDYANAISVLRGLSRTLDPHIRAAALMRSLGARRGDAADVAQVELVGSEYDPKAKAAAAEAPTEAGAPAKKQTVGERLRSAAKRLRPGKKEQAEEPADAEKEKKEAVPKAKARGAAKKAVKKAAKKAAPKKRR